MAEQSRDFALEEDDDEEFDWPGERRRMIPENRQPGGAADPRGRAVPEKLRPARQFGQTKRRWGMGVDLPPAPSTGEQEGEEEERQARFHRGAPASQPPVRGIPDVSQPPAPVGRPQAEVRAVADSVTKGNPQAEATKIRLHELLIDELEHGALENLPPDQQRIAVAKAARELIVQEGLSLGGVSRDELVDAVCDEVLGLGPLEPLLRDPNVSEVMVNDIDKIYFEQDGRIFRSPARFRDRQHVMRIIERIVAPLGRRIDESSPMVDARLHDGSRVNVTIPPISPKAASITIRKFRSDKMKMADLIAVGSLSESTADFLAMCVRAHLNIIVSGGTGTGKTTMLNALSSFIPHTERIVTIEDPSELKLQQEHVITLEARPASLEGKHAVSQRDLVRNTLRMRPDRIIVGEVRGPEAFDMLQAMNTGHDGSISTIHANSPRDAVARIENLVLTAGMDLPARAIREQIAAAIHVFIQISRLHDGSRKVTHVTEISGMEGETITLQDIFLFQLDHVDEAGKVHGSMKPTGIRPSFVEKFDLAGIDLPPNLFDSGREW